MGISKRGNTYLRKILVHGTQAAVYRIKRDHAPIGAWMDALERRAHLEIVYKPPSGAIESPKNQKRLIEAVWNAEGLMSQASQR